MRGWQKGQSGNPSGRPRADQIAPLRELARAHCPKAIKRLAHLMEHGESEAVQVSAAGMLLDRGYGRPAQAVHQTVVAGKPARQLTRSELRAELAQALEEARLERAGAVLALPDLSEVEIDGPEN